MPVRVASARESAALDAAAIESGVPSRALMRVAGANAASVIARRYTEPLLGKRGNSAGVTVYTGAGNNGGDGWVVARSLAAMGLRVHVCEVVPALSADAVAERASAVDSVVLGEAPTNHLIVDALLGTGASGPPRGAIADTVRRINAQRECGAHIVALDAPTGLDSMTGEHSNCVVADLTIAFATCKRGHLISRDVCGEIVVVDIGLQENSCDALATQLPTLVDAAWVQTHLPLIPFDAHKGVRKKLVIIAGGKGMGGAAILAADAALRSGIGMVQVVTHKRNVSAVQSRLPEALTLTLPLTDDILEDIVQWADAILIGPGLGQQRDTRDLVERVLSTWSGPIVIDADALTVFSNDTTTLATLLHGRPAIITPHVVEFARLIASDAATVLKDRFDIGRDVARTLNAAVLLKGTPTVVTAPDGSCFISPSGTAALGTGGSGDTLGGIVATLLAQGCKPTVAATCGAWVHGHAASLAGSVRGVTLQDILNNLPTAWRAMEDPSPLYPMYPILAQLPSSTMMRLA